MITEMSDSWQRLSMLTSEFRFRYYLNHEGTKARRAFWFMSLQVRLCLTASEMARSLRQAQPDLQICAFVVKKQNQYTKPPSTEYGFPDVSFRVH
ncbi:MAG TPA: hypothetical protein DIW81_05655 [Planctomycetaceae bacterium]|nr:hypothetical protein [Planctomycetaceae bacterium]